MNSLRPESAAAMTAHRREAVRLARAQEKAVYERCKRSNQTPPAYTFDELIGKGSFGRVYKGRQNSTAKIVAIKVLDIDEADFHSFGDHKDEQIRDFNREIQILRQAQESGAENLNQMIEALPVYSQLWLICEYCPGGSVKTLMRATHDRLAEKFLVVVARELAKALKGLHNAGIMHRDVKAANVLIHESGGVQLCDFGVAATLEGSKDKRRTFIGTLHWMPPELWDDKPEYSDEVDVWGYGCTLFECALGRPPNSDVRETKQLKMRMRRLKQSISLPEKESFSAGLRSLVQYALNPDVASRPSMLDILHHDYLTDTEVSHPTYMLTELVQHYYAWLFGGGQRISLFMPGGAAAAKDVVESEQTVTDEWNFSMTQDFEKRVSAILEIPDLSEYSYLEDPDDQVTPRQPNPATPASPQGMTAVQKANFEKRVQRGEGLANIFDQSKPAYEYKAKTDFVPVATERRISDLPFRAMAEDRPSSIASNVIDLGDFDSEDYAAAAPKSTDNHIQTVYATTPMKDETAFRLADAATIRAKRADSKGPNNAGTRRSSWEERPKVPAGTEAQDFAATQDDWTVRDDRRSEDDAVETTPTATKSRSQARQTMEWSFASAMDELTQKREPHEGQPVAPSIDVMEATLDRNAQAKAKKHATLEWSFANAMAEMSSDPGEPVASSELPRRPAPLLRTMTQPVTHNEVHDAYEDPISRPATSLSFATSESSMSSTDFDPFSLDNGVLDDSVAAELEEIGVGEFYATRGRHVATMSLNGPGPEDRMSRDFHTDSHSVTSVGEPQSVYDDFPGGTVTAASSRPGHYRGNGSRASAHSTESKGSARMNTLAPHTPQTTVGSGIQHNERHSTSSAGTRVSSLAAVGFPEPKPPSYAAMSANSDPAVVERELQRLLEDFQGALGVAGDLLNEELRGRGRDRDHPRRASRFGPAIINESGSEWEDEDGHDE